MRIIMSVRCFESNECSGSVAHEVDSMQEHSDHNKTLCRHFNSQCR